jgi:hypothetical protein
VEPGIRLMTLSGRDIKRSRRFYQDRLGAKWCHAEASRCRSGSGSHCRRDGAQPWNRNSVGRLHRLLRRPRRLSVGDRLEPGNPVARGRLYRPAVAGSGQLFGRTPVTSSRLTCRLTVLPSCRLAVLQSLHNRRARVSHPALQLMLYLSFVRGKGHTLWLEGSHPFCEVLSLSATGGPPFATIGKEGGYPTRILRLWMSVV